MSAIPDRYADLDELLAEALAYEDDAEELGLIAGDQRETCYTHRAWYAVCWRNLSHANRVTGHNWCRPCDLPIIDCAHQFMHDPFAAPTAWSTT